MMSANRARSVETPFGIGEFVYYDENKQEVVVEMDREYLVRFDKKDCYIFADDNCRYLFSDYLEKIGSIGYIAD